MKSSKAVSLATVATLIVVVVLTVRVLDARQAGVTRTELQRHALSVSGREVIQVRVELSPGQVFPSHTHPGEEIIYVLEGAWEYEIAGKPVKAGRGDVLFVPAGTPHSAKNGGTGNAVELATYVVEQGKPLLTFVGDVADARR